MRRPVPQQKLDRFTPAPELIAWIHQTIQAPGAIHNPDPPLVDAELAFLWAPSAFKKVGRAALGQAELVMFRAGCWQKWPGGLFHAVCRPVHAISQEDRREWSPAFQLACPLPLIKRNSSFGAGSVEK